MSKLSERSTGRPELMASSSPLREALDPDEPPVPRVGELAERSRRSILPFDVDVIKELAIALPVFDESDVVEDGEMLADSRSADRQAVRKRGREGRHRLAGFVIDMH
jgi:hypothetical protein